VSVFDATALAAAGVGADSVSAAAVRGRANIFEMTEAAEKAVLRPADCGAFPHDLRAALAAGSRETRATRRWRSAISPARARRRRCPRPPMRMAIWRSCSTSSIVSAESRATWTAEDVARLRAGGVSDADIVRLCELVAFVAYQIRVVAGLRLLGGTT
jgi:hypothetical protein